jgi:hypothetical protein
MRSELFLNKMMCSSQYPCENFLKVRGLTLHIILVGGFNPSEKYESQLELLFHIYIWKNKLHVPNHQPEYVIIHT